MNRRPSPRFSRILPWAVVVLASLLGCERSQSARHVQAVPNGAFAVVGARALEQDLLRHSRGALHPRDASKALIGDVRVELEARARRPDHAAVIERGALVRGLVDTLRAQTLRQAPPRAEELDAAARELWAQLDRPRSVRTINVMAEVPALADGQKEERVMRRLADELRGAPTPEELNRRVDAADKEGVNVVLLVVPPLTEDGRIYVETPADAGAFQPPVEYAQAAARLTHVGETSGVVTTPFGYHVIMALDIVPPLAAVEPERSRRLVRAVADRRLESELERLKANVTARTVVWRNPHQTALTSLVWRTSSGP